MAFGLQQSSGSTNTEPTRTYTNEGGGLNLRQVEKDMQTPGDTALLERIQYMKDINAKFLDQLANL